MPVDNSPDIDAQNAAAPDGRSYPPVALLPPPRSVAAALLRSARLPRYAGRAQEYAAGSLLLPLSCAPRLRLRCSPRRPPSGGLVPPTATRSAPP